MTLQKSQLVFCIRTAQTAPGKRRSGPLPGCAVVDFRTDDSVDEQPDVLMVTSIRIARLKFRWFPPSTISVDRWDHRRTHTLCTSTDHHLSSDQSPCLRQGLLNGTASTDVVSLLEGEIGAFVGARGLFGGQLVDGVRSDLTGSKARVRFFWITRQTSGRLKAD
jgi:hypothetical protein